VSRHCGVFFVRLFVAFMPSSRKVNLLQWQRQRVSVEGYRPSSNFGCDFMNASCAKLTKFTWYVHFWDILGPKCVFSQGFAWFLLGEFSALPTSCSWRRGAHLLFTKNHTRTLTRLDLLKKEILDSGRQEFRERIGHDKKLFVQHESQSPLYDGLHIPRIEISVLRNEILTSWHP